MSEQEVEAEVEAEQLAVSIVMAGEDLEAEAEACLSIYGPVIENTHSSLEYVVPSVEEFSMRMSNCLKKYPWLLAKHPTLGIVGYAYATSYKARAAYRWTVETSVYVSSSAHRLQVGSKLYKSLFAILTRLNIRSVFVCIGIPNEKSIGFHKRLGFDVAGVLRRAGFKRGRWIDSMWLQKFLPEDGDHASSKEPYTEDLDIVIPEPISITDLSHEEIGVLIEKGFE